MYGCLQLELKRNASKLYPDTAAVKLTDARHRREAFPKFLRRRSRLLGSERARPRVRRDDYPHPTRPPRRETAMGLLVRHGLHPRSDISVRLTNSFDVHCAAMPVSSVACPTDRARTTDI